MISSTRRRCAISSVQRRAEAQQLPEEIRVHLQRAARHDVVERAHAAKQRDILERARDAADRRLMRAHFRARLALEQNAAVLRMIESVDHVEHRGLAGAVRADDGADFALADIERNIGERLHAAERQRNIFDRQQHLAGGGVGGAARSHAAFPIAAAAAPATGMSRIATSPAITPLRPSSNVTSTEIFAVREPS